MEDRLAQFSGDPVTEFSQLDDVWESVDGALNGVIGFGDVLMRGVYQAKPRRSRKKKPLRVLPISDAHSTRLALRYGPC
jgi:hypothetical protein